jgi:diguanylate cyclase (GGDEF)-like protein
MVRRNLARHHTSLARFKQRVGQLSYQQQEAAWRELCREASEMLTPTLRLATQIATAYDQIRQQTNHLMMFTEVHTDPLTGISNRRALDDAITSQFAMMNRYDTQFSVAIFDIDHFKQVNDEQGHLQGDQILQRLARLLDESVRETDVLARYGGEEFVVVMPQTGLDGACIFAERLRTKVEREMEVTVSGGVAEALDGDTPETLMARADAALYAAKKDGRNSVSRHTGEQVESVFEPAGA